MVTKSAAKSFPVRHSKSARQATAPLLSAQKVRQPRFGTDAADYQAMRAAWASWGYPHECELCAEAGWPSPATRMARWKDWENMHAEGLEAHFFQCEYDHEHALTLEFLEWLPITPELVELRKAERVHSALELESAVFWSANR